MVESPALLADPTHGRLREPLLKVLHFMRAMELDSLDGREVLVGYRNDDEGQPLGVPIAELDQAFVWKQVLDTVDFALRASAQEPLFP